MGGLTRSKKQEKRQSSAFLKVVHPHGHVEIFREPITAGEILRRYPRHCIARPDFFEFPWIVVRPESVLVPGEVFFLVSHKTVDKVLKEKRQQIQQNRDQNVTPNDQQDHRYYSRQTNHHHHHHRSNEESCCNGREEQDSDNGSLYKSSFYESWKEMQRNLEQPHQEIYDQLDLELDSSLELQRVKSCLRKADSDRKKLNLKVRFGSSVVILGSRSGSPSVQ